MTPCKAASHDVFERRRRQRLERMIGAGFDAMIAAMMLVFVLPSNARTPVVIS